MNITPVPAVRVRTASADDIPALVRVINAAFASERYLEGTRTNEDYIRKTMRKGEFFLAEMARGEVVACVYVEVRGERGYFGLLAVDPAQQHRGLGRRMMQIAEDCGRSHDCRFMDISVLSLRTHLPPYYRKLGYLETGTEEFHPLYPLKAGVECHLILMSKKL